FDPGDYVDLAAEQDAPALVAAKVAALPWEALESSPQDLARRYVRRALALETGQISLEEAAVLRAAAKYGRALEHVVMLYRHLATKGIPFEVEISVDETDAPTSLTEHVYMAGELARLGVRWVSLAPRYVGRFEKGIDYIGDPDALAKDLDGHAQVARALGPYKLSLHSGSDKLTVYPLIAHATRGMVHLKTAGTSYVEALRVVARHDSALFRAILALAREHYRQDQASYHVSADVGQVPDGPRVADGALVGLLDQRDTRQVLHVTFGSVLAALGGQIKAALQAHEQDYAETLDAHFYRHLDPLMSP
ncbi:MAG TPA: tagaturonate epimerase family protein, partial [Ktedonobacterales bacterium]